MSGKRAFVLLAISTALSFLGAASAVANDMDSGHGGEVGGSVAPCSLAGINPAHHPEIFGNPAVAARDYGFVKSRDGTWQVQDNCFARSQVPSPPVISGGVHIDRRDAPRSHRPPGGR